MSARMFECEAMIAAFCLVFFHEIKLDTRLWLHTALSTRMLEFEAMVAASCLVFFMERSIGINYIHHFLNYIAKYKL